MATEYDAIIIGAGQAGGPLAHKLADLGWKVALIEKDHLGGSCVNYGCTPTKITTATTGRCHLPKRLRDHAVERIDVEFAGQRNVPNAPRLLRHVSFNL